MQHPTFQQVESFNALYLAIGKEEEAAIKVLALTCIHTRIHMHDIVSRHTRQHTCSYVCVT